MSTKAIAVPKGRKIKDDFSVNEIKIIGRFSGPASEKDLPSGEKVVELRVIVTRDDREGVDTISVAVWKSMLRRRALTLQDNQWIVVKGVLRRRFWKSPTGLASRYQVEARDLARI